MKLFKYNLIIILLFCICCKSKINTQISTSQNDSLNRTILKYIKKDNKAKVLFALDPECPLCKSYSKTINELCDKYENTFDFYAFFPSTIYSENKTNNFLIKNNITMNVIIDTNQVITEFLNATVTPECFLLDTNLNIIYQGLIDDWVKALGRKGQNINNNYLDDAIRKYIYHDSILINKTTAIGCIIERFK
ncbi:MAG: hypothetical protein CMP49_03455 [Flavobacteriales bacterium]|nr:hypothetical protein [Flavobacteriales bacterium]|tara:strand:- start:14228 stop:14803 length:576 start_codon:yes stop_codon:yes gene_type:complete